MMAPALGLPDLTKPFELFVHERQHLALGVLAQWLGSWKRPVGYFSKQLDTVSKGWPGCLRAEVATVLLIQEARKLTMGQKIVVYVPHMVITVLEQKGGHWLSPSRMLKYQVVLLEQDDVELKTTAIVNPAMFLSTENPTEKLEHDRLLTIEQVYSSRPDLKDEPLKDPDLELFMDGSSFVQEGRRMAGYAVVTTNKVLESGTPPANTSAQKAELVALKQALRMAEGKRVNIQTDSKYAFGVIHAHGAIWKERGLLSAQGSLIRHKEEVLQLLQDVQELKEVAVMHCKAHQFGQMAVNVGNRLADKAAKEAAGQGILALVPVKQIKIPNLKARYSKLDEQLAEHLKASQNTEGWWVTPENQGWNFTPEQLQGPDKVVEYLKGKCCGYSKEAQLTALCWALATIYQTLLNSRQHPQGEERENRLTYTVATQMLLTGTAAERKKQPVLVSVAPIQKKKYTKKSDCLVRDDDEPGPSREQEEETEPEVITRSLSLSEL
ncbi:protein NYNRIN-like [Grus japonensis]|uniref:Protein NYNRIN-like n=1 Tax=Grus japonensis TaxID=30415 RepID=A0ABC9YJP3_GRUJA